MPSTAVLPRQGQVKLTALTHEKITSKIPRARSKKQKSVIFNI